MNPFLLAFFGTVCALALVIVIVYTYVQFKIRPMFAKMFGPEMIKQIDAERDPTKVFGIGARWGAKMAERDERMVEAAKVGATLRTAQAAGMRVDDEQRTDWELGILDVLEGKVDPDTLDECPMCTRPFEGPPGQGRIVHLCEDHGRACPGCPTILSQFEAFAHKQGLANMLPHEIDELARLRSLFPPPPAAESAPSASA
jgi:hypothetical protein